MAEKAGVTLGNWSTGATLGRLRRRRASRPLCRGLRALRPRPSCPSLESKAWAMRDCEYRGALDHVRPARAARRARPPLPQQRRRHLYRREQESRRGRQSGYYGLTAIFVDVNNDGKPDLLVANDSDAELPLHQQGRRHVRGRELSVAAIALNKDGREIAAMGIAVGDYQNNGLLDLVSPTSPTTTSPLSQRWRRGDFTDISIQAGIAQIVHSLRRLGRWLSRLRQRRLEGLLDGQRPRLSRGRPARLGHNSTPQRPLLFHNLTRTASSSGCRRKGTGLAVVTVARGAAFGDLFNDGKIDVVINPMDGPPVLLRNVNPDHHHWVELKLIGGPKSPRDAVGATVYLTADGIRKRDDVLSGGSYHFVQRSAPALRPGRQLNRCGDVEIHWPSGKVEQWKLPAVDRHLHRSQKARESRVLFVPESPAPSRALPPRPINMRGQNERRGIG